MMKKIYCLLLLAALVSSCYFQKEYIPLSGQTETKEITINPFCKLDVQNAIEVIVCDTVTNARIETDAALISYLHVAQSGKKLVIGYQRDIYWMADCISRVLIPADKVDNLNHIHVSGASSVYFSEPLCTKTIEMYLSGASSLYATLHINSMETHISGSSHAFLDGEAESMKVQISGASSVHSELRDGKYTLDVTRFIGNMSGSSIANIHCDGQIDANLSGASTIFYTGTADTHSCTCSGVSSVMHEATDIN